MSAKIGRNDPCPCGSGEKYKRCCLSVKNCDRQPPVLVDDDWQKLRQTEGELNRISLTRIHFLDEVDVEDQGHAISFREASWRVQVTERQFGVNVDLGRRFAG